MSQRFGIDCTAGNLPDPATLNARGITFVVGYLSRNSWKVWTKTGIDRTRKAGVDVVFVFEDAAVPSANTVAVGQADARFADQQMRALGAPADTPIYFALDKDVSAANWLNYVAGLVSVLGKKRVGIYAGIKVISYLLDRNLIGRAWQTYAWSGGQLDPRADLYQYSNGQKIGSCVVDFDYGYGADFGQWPAEGNDTMTIQMTQAQLVALIDERIAAAGGKPAAPPASKPPAAAYTPPPGPFGLPAGHYYGLITGPAASHGGYYPAEQPAVKWIQTRLNQLGYGPVPADGTFGAATQAAVAKWQKARHAKTTSRPGQVWADDWANLTKDR